jgi:hypothetical protein
MSSLYVSVLLFVSSLSLISSSLVSTYNLTLFNLNFNPSTSITYINDNDLSKEFQAQLVQSIHSAVAINTAVATVTIIDYLEKPAADSFDSSFTAQIVLIPLTDGYDLPTSAYNTYIQTFQSLLDSYNSPSILQQYEHLNDLSSAQPYSVKQGVIVYQCSNSIYAFDCPSVDDKHYIGSSGLAAGILVALCLLLLIGVAGYICWIRRMNELDTNKYKLLKPEQRKLMLHLHNSNFKQQKLQMWKPHLTLCSAVLSYSLLGSLFILLGGIFYKANQDLQYVSFRYDNLPACSVNTNFSSPSQLCTISIKIPHTIQAPIYMYYGIENFYQNHRNYIKSRNDNQLTLTGSTGYSDCAPLATFSDGGSRISNANQSQVSFSQGKYLYPCGLISQSYFSDEFLSPCVRRRDSLGNSVCTPLLAGNWKSRGIAWPSDKAKYKSRPLKDSETPFTIRGFTMPPVDSEEFLVWLRVEVRAEFQKLHRIIAGRDLLAGEELQLTVDNRFDVESLNGAKYVVLANANWTGGKNLFLAIAFWVVGAITLTTGIAFWAYYRPGRFKRTADTIAQDDSAI